MQLSISLQLYATGYNEYGQLGTGNTTNANAFTKAQPFASKLSQVTVGAYHSLAVDVGGALYSWGSNTYGELGLDQSQDNVSSPKKIDWFKQNNVKALQVTGGVNFTIVLSQARELYSFGTNSANQLGRKTTGQLDTVPAPVDLKNLEADEIVIEVITSDSLNYISTSKGNYYAWGDCYYLCPFYSANTKLEKPTKINFNV